MRHPGENLRPESEAWSLTGCHPAGLQDVALDLPLRERGGREIMSLVMMDRTHDRQSDPDQDGRRWLADEAEVPSVKSKDT